MGSDGHLHRSRPFGTRGPDFSFESTDAEVIADLEHLLGWVRGESGSRAATIYEIVPPAQDVAGAAWSIEAAGDQLCQANDRRALVDHFIGRLNILALDADDGCLHLHCAGTTSGGAGMVIVGARNAGKSTLTAALVASGLGYITDETICVLDDATIDGWAKPLSLRAGSIELVSRLTDTEPASGRWDVAPADLAGPGGAERQPCGPVSAELIVFPERSNGAAASLEVVHRADAVYQLAADSLDLGRHGPSRGLGLLGRLAAGADCVRAHYDSATDMAGVLAHHLATGRRAPIGAVIELPTNRPAGSWLATDVGGVIIDGRGVLHLGATDQLAALAPEATEVVAAAARGQHLDEHEYGETIGSLAEADIVTP